MNPSTDCTPEGERSSLPGAVAQGTPDNSQGAAPRLPALSDAKNDTPRTDAARMYFPDKVLPPDASSHDDFGYFVSAQFARQLERELAHWKACHDECVKLGNLPSAMGNNEIPGLRLALEHIAAQHAVWDKTEINAWHLLNRLEGGIVALIDNRMSRSDRTTAK